MCCSWRPVCYRTTLRCRICCRLPPRSSSLSSGDVPEERGHSRRWSPKRRAGHGGRSPLLAGGVIGRGPADRDHHDVVRGREETLAGWWTETRISGRFPFAGHSLNTGRMNRLAGHLARRRVRTAGKTVRQGALRPRRSKTAAAAAQDGKSNESSGSRGGGRAGAGSGIAVGSPRWRRIRATTGGSSIAAEEPQATAARRTREDVDREDAPEELGPGEVAPGRSRRYSGQDQWLPDRDRRD